VKAIILGAGRGIRRLKSADSYPISLIEDERGLKVLDWILASLKSNGIDDINFVGGYHVEKLIQSYSKLRYFYNHDWDSTGSLNSLMCAKEVFAGDCLVVSADAIFHAEVVESILASEGDIVSGYIDVDRQPQYSGCVKFTAHGASMFRDAFEKAPKEIVKKKSLLNFLNSEVQSSYEINKVNLTGDWLKIDDDLSISRFVMSSKGKTLERLQRIVKSANILDQVRCTVAKWRETPDNLIFEIQDSFPNQSIIVRSSSIAEDSFTESKAGHFESVLNVDSSSASSIAHAVQKVIASFGDATIEEKDEIFIQPMVQDIAVSGVLFTKDIKTGADYILINYDDRSGRSDTVTSGDSILSAAIAFKDRLDLLPKKLLPLKDVIIEIERILDFDALDIEFAIDEAGRAYVLQVRPITSQNQSFTIKKEEVLSELLGAEEYITGEHKKHIQMVGDKTLFSDMSDWNPAEIIGTAPKVLASSLYRTLITDKVWAVSRAQLGYRNVDNVPLMSLIAGKPYINMRASFNSFLPASVPSDLAQELVDIYILHLEKNPQLYDKIEFEIVPTCLDFDFFRYQKLFDQYGLESEKQDVLKNCLKTLTENIVKQRVTPNSEVEEDMMFLDSSRNALLANSTNSVTSICRTIDLLIKSCVDYGTVTFSNVARHAFIATSFLRSMLSRGIIDQNEFDSILESMSTVASNTSECIARVVSGSMLLSEFIETYGHLRPGTYDITIPSYGEDPEKYLGHHLGADNSGDLGLIKDRAKCNLLRSKAESISSLIAESQLDITVDELIGFIERSIPLRESVKFEFTKNLSHVLTLLKELSSKTDLTIDELSHLPISSFTDSAVHGMSEPLIDTLKQHAKLNQKRHALHASIHMPGLVTSTEDLFAFEEEIAKPNFVSGKSLTADIIEVAGNTDKDLSGHLILIESADPGYDWLFSHEIAGLITKYGGVASHMAIRCSEFHLPAVIGCGELLYEQLKSAKRIHLDCTAQKIEVLCE
jgi:glutamine kinase